MEAWLFYLIVGSIIGLVVGFIWGSYRGFKFGITFTIQNAEQLANSLAEGNGYSIPARTARVESVGDRMYAYDKDTGDFLFNFQTVNELRDGLIKEDETCAWYLTKESRDLVIQKHLENGNG